MKIGLSLNTHGGAYGRGVVDADVYRTFLDRLVAQARLADEAGFDTVYVAERHARHETFFPAPLLLLGILATHTERVRLATHVLLLALYNPAHVAEQAALVDLASRGRLILGIGLGFNDDYFAAFGIEKKERRARLDEGLDVLDLAWSGERFDYDGEMFHYRGAQILPRPYRRPRPVVWIGGQSVAAVRRAARRGDCWPIAWPLGGEELARLHDAYHEECAAQGKRGEIAITRHCWVGEDRAAVEQLYAPLWLEDLKYYWERGQIKHPDFQSAADFTLETARRHLIMGTPADCVEAIQRCAEEGYDHLKISMRLPLGPSMDEADRALELLCREVMPAVSAVSAVAGAAGRDAEVEG
ncbi:MAG: class flavin-dependent oxidoreductase [Conexibacter sp.]|nr:class flavin-dependent oxidoreductase [Conexibacter sp.]